MFKSLFKRRGDTVQHYADVQQVNAILKSGKTLDYLDKSKLLGCKKKVYLQKASEKGYVYDSIGNEFIQKRNCAEIAITKDTTEDEIIQNILTRLETLEDKMTQSSTNSNSTFELHDSLKECHIVTRGIKADKTALENFDKLASTKLAMYTKQELISQALLEFVDKYK